MKKYLLIAIFSAISLSSFAQFTLTGEVRPRYEFRNGFKTLRPVNDFTPASFVEQRTRIYFNYQKDKLKFYVALQDIRMWGNHNQIYKADPALTNLFEGYAEYNFAPKWYVKIGRQVLSYDTQRFLGGLDWAQQGRSHDAVLFRYKTEKDFKLDLAFAINNSGVEFAYLGNTFYAPANYKNMQMAHVSKKWSNAYVSLLFQNDGRQSVDTSGNKYRQTIGIVTNGKVAKNLFLAGEFYYQMGMNSVLQDVSSFFFNAQATLKTKLTPITIGIDYASGTKLENAGSDNAWNPLYGTNHKWYGFMDYFYVGNPHGQGGRTTGLIDIYLKTNFKLAEKHKLALHGHYFMSPVTIYDTRTLLPNTVELSSGLGVELDLVYKFVISKEINLQVGYSQLFAQESFEAIKNNGLMDGRASETANNWAFVMIQFKPELFTNKKK